MESVAGSPTGFASVWESFWRSALRLRFRFHFRSRFLAGAFDRREAKFHGIKWDIWIAHIALRINCKRA